MPLAAAAGPFSGSKAVYGCPGLVRAVAVLAATAGAAIVVASVGARPIDGTAAKLSPRIAIFFYPWYGTPTRDGAYQHWGQHDTDPPPGIASSYYPARGVYSSTDPAVLRGQMTDIADAHVGTVIVSWWGAGSPEDQRLPAVIDAARSFGIRVAIHIEPYQGRTPAERSPPTSPGCGSSGSATSTSTTRARALRTPTGPR